jgi:hypothetical protein
MARQKAWHEHGVMERAAPRAGPGDPHEVGIVLS